MKQQDWLQLGDLERREIIRKFKLSRSAPTRVLSTGVGIDVVEDDGIRDGDLEALGEYTVDDLRKILAGEEVKEVKVEPKDEPKLEVEITKTTSAKTGPKVVLGKKTKKK